MPGFDSDVGEDYIEQAKQRLSTIVQQSLSGSDDKSSSPKICPKCMGSGKWYMEAEDGEGFKCRKCNGSGRIF
jgi:DnaJ-class molecular chaperone